MKMMFVAISLLALAGCQNQPSRPMTAAERQQMMMMYMGATGLSNTLSPPVAAPAQRMNCVYGPNHVSCY